MSVLIRGMSGYECCADCEFCGGMIMPDGIYTCDCPPTRGMNITRAIEEDCKHPDCPLAELPEKHGRLIDADALIAEWKDVLSTDGISPMFAMVVEGCIRDVERAKAIVKAEGD